MGPTSTPTKEPEGRASAWIGRTRFRVRATEVAVWTRYRDVVGLSGPGEYRVWSRLWSAERRNAFVVNRLDSRVNPPLMEIISRLPEAAKYMHVVTLTQSQRALVWKDKRLECIIGPGRHAFWKEPATIEIEVIDAEAAPKFTDPRMDGILAHPEARQHLDVFAAGEHSATMHLVDGVVQGRLAPGKHVFWKGTGVHSTVSHDLREQTSEVSGQEIMTNDKVTLRLTLIVTWRITDADKVASKVADAKDTLYRESQMALRAAIGGRSLDQLLADKESLGTEVGAVLRLRAAEFGVDVRSVGVRDIILPGEMKAILNQVIEAEKRAQAEIIKRREETASARSQANTAKLLAENPLLARFKELELLQEIIKGSNATFVLGSGDLAEQFRSLLASKPNT